MRQELEVVWKHLAYGMRWDGLRYEPLDMGVLEGKEALCTSRVTLVSTNVMLFNCNTNRPQMPGTLITTQQKSRLS